jgi:hypothetical protein
MSLVSYVSALATGITVARPEQTANNLARSLSLSLLFHALEWLVRIRPELSARFHVRPSPELVLAHNQTRSAILISFSITSSFLSLLAKLWNPLVSLISPSMGNLDSRMSPSLVRRRVLVLVQV